MFRVQVDPVNLVNCTAIYYRTAELIRDVFARLGLGVISCHTKDIIRMHNLGHELVGVVAGVDGRCRVAEGGWA